MSTRRHPRPSASSTDVAERMSRQRRRDTSPELALRSLLHRQGLRFRVDQLLVPGLRRRADIVFRPVRVAVFVDGCFWHVCPEHQTWPKSNAEWWRQKLQRNVERDRQTDDALRAAGWYVIRVWEHENPADAASQIAAVVRSRREGTTQ